MVSLGQKIRQRRLEKGLTQGQLAKGLASASAISQIESDKINPSYKLLCQIAKRLEVPLDFFLSEKEEYLEQTTSHKLAKTFISAKEYANAVPILEKLLASAPEDDLDLMKDLATCYLQLNNFRATNDLLEKILNLSLKEEQHYDYVWTMQKMGHLFFLQNNISLALHYWKKSYDCLQTLDSIDPFLRAEVTTNLATAYNRLGDYDQSFKLFRESQDLMKNSSNPYHLASNYLGLGYSLYGQKEYKLAEEYWQQAISIFKNLDHIRFSIKVKENLGILSGEKGDYEEALDVLFDCLGEYQENNFDQNISNTHAEITKLLIRLQRFEEATEHIEQAFRTCKPDTIYHAQCFYVRSLLHSTQENYSSAIEDARKAIQLYISAESIQEYNKACLHLSDIYKKLGDYKSSTEVLEESQHHIQAYLRERGVVL